jgi:hypothetical protein
MRLVSGYYWRAYVAQQMYKEMAASIKLNGIGFLMMISLHIRE